MFTLRLTIKQMSGKFTLTEVTKRGNPDFDSDLRIAVITNPDFPRDLLGRSFER